MARVANPATKIKKLEGDIIKLKEKNAKLATKLDDAKETLKEKTVSLKLMLSEKVEQAFQQGYEKAMLDAQKLSTAREKFLNDSLAKFEKEWNKKNKSSTKVVKSKKTEIKKESTKKSTTKVATSPKAAKTSKETAAKKSTAAASKTVAKKRGRPAKVQKVQTEETQLLAETA